METTLKRSKSDLDYTGDSSRFELSFYVDSYLDIKNQVTDLEPTITAIIKAVRERYPTVKFDDSDVLLDLFGLYEPGDYSWKAVFIKGYGFIGQVLGRFKELPDSAIMMNDRYYHSQVNTVSYRKLKVAGIEVHELMHTPLGPVTSAEMGAFLTERNNLDKSLKELLRLAVSGTKGELLEALKTNPALNLGNAHEIP
jgi:hypothetical protein